MSEPLDLKTAWQRVQQVLHEGEINRSLWNAAALATPLTVEDDLLVLGFPPGNMREASYLTSTTNRQQVNRALEAVFGRRLTVETIEGTDEGAWQREKERRALAAEQAKSSFEARLLKGARVAWAELYEEIGRTFGSARERRFPLSRARTLVQALKLTLQAEQKAREQEPNSDELHTQQLNRTIDRIAVLAELPATLVAIEYLRLKASRD